MSIVVDTNVFISALMGRGGHSRRVLRACLKGEYIPLMGTKLFLEFESVIGRETLFQKCRLSGDERQSVFDAFLHVCRWVTVYYTWRPNLPDEGDNHILELAVAGGAETIVTQNTKDFQDGALLFPAIQILHPKDFPGG